MRILVSSHFFAPSVGGIEQVSGILAEEFCRMGHEVRVLTTTPADREPAGQPFTVLRSPSFRRLLSEVRWCDAYLQSNISLATLWPAILLRKPTLVTYQTWISRPNGRTGLRDYVKQIALRFTSRNIAISKAVADSIGSNCVIVPNPYRDDLFRADSSISRDRDLVFLGRLVSDKGADILIDSLVELKRRGLAPSLSIIGAGPEHSPLRQQVTNAKLDAQVHFEGQRTGANLVKELNRHRVLVVPSRWMEPFGIVALEGLACDLIPVVSSGGGLLEATGNCGLSFPNGDAFKLADQLERVLTESELRAKLLSGARKHLARHSRSAISAAYLQQVKEIVRRSP